MKRQWCCWHTRRAASQISLTECLLKFQRTSHQLLIRIFITWRWSRAEVRATVNRTGMDWTLPRHWLCSNSSSWTESSRMWFASIFTSGPILSAKESEQSGLLRSPCSWSTRILVYPFCPGKNMNHQNAIRLAYCNRAEDHIPLVGMQRLQICVFFT